LDFKNFEREFEPQQQNTFQT